MDLFFSPDTGSFWLIAKIALLVGISLYIVFAYVLLRQVKLMNATLEVGYEKAIRYAAYIHLIFSVFVLLLAVVIL